MRSETEIQLTPYVGAGTIRFGMTDDEVQARLGPPVRVDTNLFDERDALHGSIRLRFDANTHRVVEIALFPDSHVVVFGQPLFELEDPVAYLCEHDDAFELHGFLIFMRLGMTLTGFHDNDPGQRALTLFCPGRMDRYTTRMRPYQHSGRGGIST